MTASLCDMPIRAFARYTDTALMGDIWRERLPSLLAAPFEFSAINVQYARCRTYLNPESWHKSYLCVCYEFDGVPEVKARHKPMLYGRAYLQGRSQSEFDALERRDGARIVPELDMIVWNFPDDPQLCQLRELLDLARVSQHFPFANLPFNRDGINDVLIDVIRYRPEQRCILRYDIDYGANRERFVLYAKVFADDNGEQVHGRIQRCYSIADAFGVRIAKPLGYSAVVRTVWQEELCGESLVASLESGRFEKTVAAIGYCLAKLHSVDLPMQKAVTREARLADAAKKSRKLAQMLPELDAALAALIARGTAELPQLSSAPQAIIHGDVHFGQFLITDDGQLALFDFDEWSRGDPAQDLADLIVDPHVSQFVRDKAKTNQILSARVARKLLVSYRAHAAWTISEAVVNWHAGIQLINKAYRAAIQQEPRWQEKVPALVALATRGIDFAADLAQELVHESA
jgi:aminoglycoside phosphotransferase (APT) family kinase protein